MNETFPFLHTGKKELKNMAKEKVSFKTPSILDGAKKIYELLKESKKSIEAMPECGIKTSLMLTQEAFEKKINGIVKKEQIAKALSAIKKNPEAFIAALPDDLKASFASSDEKLSEVVEGAANVKKSKGKK